MGLLVVLGALTAISMFAMLGLGVDSRDNENWNPIRPAAPRPDTAPTRLRHRPGHTSPQPTAHRWSMRHRAA